MNRMAALKMFFEKNSAPVAMPEMAQFWKSLSEDEKAGFSQAAAKQLGVELTN